MGQAQLRKWNTSSPAASEAAIPTGLASATAFDSPPSSHLVLAFIPCGQVQGIECHTPWFVCRTTEGGGSTLKILDVHNINMLTCAFAMD